MTTMDYIFTGVIKKTNLDSHVTAFEWFLIHMGWRLEITDLTKKIQL